MSSNVHGRKREALSAEIIEARRKEEAAKIQEYNGLVSQCQSKFRDGIFTEETLQLTTRILSWNPDFYTIWNIRRLILIRGILNKGSPLSDEAACLENRKIYVQELGLFMQLIRKNPKSYWLWNHRRWCLETMPDPDWNAELALVDKLLTMDARNFHGWNYRRYVVRQLRSMARTEEEVTKIVKEEYDFTTRKINQSFSNYSAWHQRSKLLPEIVSKMTPEEKNAVARNELDLVKAAVYTDPDDQSAWLYYRWLVGRAPETLNLVGVFRFSESTAICVIFDDNVTLIKDPVLLDGDKHAVSGIWVQGRSTAKNSMVWIFYPDTGSKTPTSYCINPSVIRPSTSAKSKPTSLWQGSIQMVDYVPTDMKDSKLYTRPDDAQICAYVFPANPQAADLDIQDQPVWHSLDANELLTHEIGDLRELLELEPNSKWALQTLAHFLQQQILRGGSENVQEADNEIISIFSKLMELDTYRKRRYEDAKNRAMFERDLRLYLNHDSVDNEQGAKVLWKLIKGNL